MRRFLAAMLAIMICVATLPLPVRAEELPLEDAIPDNAAVTTGDADDALPAEEKVVAGTPEPEAEEDITVIEAPFPDEDAESDDLEIEEVPLEDDGDDEDEPFLPGDAEEDDMDAPSEELEGDLQDILEAQTGDPEDDGTVEEPTLDQVNDELADLAEGDSEVIEEIASLADASLDNDSLFRGYIASILARKTQVSYSAGNALEGTAWMLYNVLREQVEAVADGRRTSTEFTFTAAELGIEDQLFTAADLGMYDFKQYGVLNALTGVSDAMHALLYDCPYDLYWFDKTAPMHLPAVIARGAVGEKDARGLISITIQLPVAGVYASGAYAVNTALPIRVRTAAANIAAIIDQSADLDNYGKLDSYRGAICALTAYDSSAADANTPYGDPWQLVSVFDGDPATSVVCEGYAKAFKYLCDESDFSGEVSCILATGSLGGGASASQHMWNVVSMPDGGNYLVDVTNCDAGTLGDPDGLFMKGGAGDPVDGAYTLSCGGRKVTYTYDLATRDTHPADRLRLAVRDYNSAEPDPQPELEPEPAAPLSVTGFVGSIEKVYDGKAGAASPDAGLYAGGVCVDEYVRVLNVTFDRVNVGEDIPCTLKLAVRKGYADRFALTSDTLRATGRITPRQAIIRYVGPPLEKFRDGSADVGMELTENLLAFDNLADDAVAFTWDSALRFDSAEPGERTATVDFAITGATAGNYTVSPLVIPGMILSRAIVGFEYTDAPATYTCSERPTAAEIAGALPHTLTARLHPEDGDLAIIEGVAWTCADYDAGETGTFVFVASGDPGDYSLASGVTWPAHTVTVTEDPETPEIAEADEENPDADGDSQDAGGTEQGDPDAPRPIDDASVTLEPIPDQTWTGTPLTPSVTLKDGDSTLVEGTDYSVTYKDNANVGQATATVAGIGSYTGTRDVNFNIVEAPAQQKDIADESIKVPAIPDQIWTGEAIEPDVTVIDGDYTLVAGTDYTLACSNNVEKGENTAVITIAGTGRYTGTRTVAFSIVEKAKIPLTIGYGGKITKVYDGNTNVTSDLGLTAEGLVDGDLLSDVVSATASYDDSNAGIDKNVTIDLALNPAYVDKYEMAVTRMIRNGEITKKTLTIKVFATPEKTYDGRTNATIGTGSVSVTGAVNNEISVSGITGKYDNKNAGDNKTVNWTVNLSGPVDNYKVSGGTLSGTNVTGTVKGKINKKELEIAGLKQAVKDYDGNTSVPASAMADMLLNGKVSGDDVSVSLDAKYDNKNAGSGKTVTYTPTLKGGDAGNYTIKEVRQTNGVINKITLSVTGLKAPTKYYDGTTSVPDKYTTGLGVSGVLSGDSVSIKSATARFDTKDAGTGKRVYFTFTLSDTTNYAVKNVTITSGSIKQKVINVTYAGGDPSKTYDGTTSVTSKNATNLGKITRTSFVSGEAITFKSDFDFDTKNVGENKTVTGTFSLVGDESVLKNYSLKVTTLKLSEKGKILKKPLSRSYVGKPLERVYDKTKNVYRGSDSRKDENKLKGSDFSISGKAKGDTLTLGKITATFDSSQVGDRTVTVGFTLSGADAANYSIEGLTLPGKITKKTLTITPGVAKSKTDYTLVSQTKVYGAKDPAYFSGRVNGLLGARKDDNGNVIEEADKLTGRLARKAGENVGSYAITVGTLSNPNYEINVLNQNPFMITAKPINASDVLLTPIANQKYTGKAVKPKVTLKYGATTLVLNKDYSVSYTSNTQAGVARVKITGIGNFKGSREAQFRIVQTGGGSSYQPRIGVTSISASGIHLASIASQKFTGKARKPAVKLTEGTKTLKLNTDYKVSYSNNVYPGTAKVTISGIGNYSGTRSATFKITGTVKALTKKLNMGASYQVPLSKKTVLNVSSSNTSIATVTKKGKVTAKAAGKATILVVFTDNTGYKLNLTAVDPSMPTKVTLAPYVTGEAGTVDGASLVLYPGGSASLTAVLAPATAWSDVSWSCSDDSVLALQDNGDGSCTVIRLGDAGAATVTATTARGGRVGSMRVLFRETANTRRVTIDQGSAARIPLGGEGLTLTALATRYDGTIFTQVTWSSDNADVADIDPVTGAVTALKAGVAYLAAAAGNGKAATLKLTVFDPVVPTMITLDGFKSTLAKGKTLKLKAVPTFPDPDLMPGSYAVKWQSDNKQIATVSSAGKVTAKKAGKVKITATINGKSVTKTITVK